MKFSCIYFLMALSLTGLKAQTAYFIDGYHGGIYGHYPQGQTGFMVEMLRKYPEWKINIEVEPETWDVVRQRDPEAYNAFKELFKDQSENGRIEYINPAYGQSYFYCINGESVIRQFSYGINLVRKHFPEAVFTTYSAEEPCFTSCLPPILKSFGFLYASTKNPNTMWGGYTRAYGGELVNWIGPDGTKILTVPRYACEDFQPRSTWQTMAWYNSKDYINRCFQAGIENPVGMCIQDAAWSSGWNKGPWLGSDTSQYYYPTQYKTWRDYIRNFSNGATTDDWYFSQEDVLVSLMWGAQVLQRLAQEVRVAENKVIVAEKMAALACLYGNSLLSGEKNSWPGERIDEAWTKLLLAQHHDCWIVPYNRLPSKRTWAEEVTAWTGFTGNVSDSIIEQSMRALTAAGNKNVMSYSTNRSSGASSKNSDDETTVTVFNTVACMRNELIEVKIPNSWKNRSVGVVSFTGKQVHSQIIEKAENLYLAFSAQVEPMGFTTYRIVQKSAKIKNATSVIKQKDGCYLLENDLYSIAIDPSKGGVIKSLKSKSLKGKEFVDVANERSFNELRGYFYKEEAFLSNTQSPAVIEILEQGPLSVKVAIHGKIGIHPFTQTIRLAQGEKRIDMTLKIDWQDNPGIGEANQTFRNEDYRKPFYDERYKLLVHFPANMSSQQIYKNAPFDVCESRLENIFFNSWDQIKHNIILNWVDLYDKTTNSGLALFADHTTSYAHGQDHPLALTVQYSGKGLWGRDYTLSRPTEISYALIPHAGTWKESHIWSEGERINEPMLAVLTAYNPKSPSAKNLIKIQDNAYELTSVTCKGRDLYVRFFNAQNDASTKSVTFNLQADRAELVELNDEVKETLQFTKTDGAMKIDLSIPPFGIRTIRLANVIERKNAQ